MCNLYSLSKGQRAIIELTLAMRDQTGNLPPLPGIFPDTMAPVVRTARDGVRELTMMRWGFPPPPNLGNAPVTNVRNTNSPYWRGWLKPEFRCVVPATSFCEWTDSKPKVPNWFALSPDRLLVAGQRTTSARFLAKTLCVSRALFGSKSRFYGKATDPKAPSYLRKKRPAGASLGAWLEWESSTPN